MKLINPIQGSPQFRGADSPHNRPAKRLHDPTLSNRAFAIFFIVTILIAITLLFAPKAGAVNATWNGTTNSTWATTTNWSASPVPGSGNTATFNNAGNGNTTLNLGTGVTINTILFDTASAAAYTIGSGGVGAQTLTLNDGGAITVNSTVTNNETVNANVVLGTTRGTGTYTFTNNSTTSGQLLTIAGSISSGSGGAAGAGKTLALAGAGNGLISGSISGNGSGSTAVVSLTKSGGGTWTLTNNNTFSGTTTISGGTLSASASGGNQALGSTSGITVNSGGTLLLGTSNQINNSATLTLSGGTFALNGQSEGAAGTTGIGALSLTSTSTIDFAAGVTTSVIQFAGVGTQTNGQVLQITNWNGTVWFGGGSERLLFAGTATDFTSQYTQSEVSFNGVLGYNITQFSGFYEVSMIPEPSTWAGATLAVAAVAFMQRRRFTRLVRRTA